MQEKSDRIGIASVRIIKGSKALGIAGCLVKCTHNGRTRLYLKTFIECIDCQSKAPYYGALKWQSEGDTAAREIEFKVKKSVLGSDGETAFYGIKLNKKLKKELIKAVPVQTSIFFLENALCVITHTSETIKATVDKVDNASIQFKTSRLPISLMKGSPIYDEEMRIVGLVKNKKLGDIWNASWVKQPSGMYL